VDPRELINVNMGRLTHEQAANIARELRYIWRYLEDIRPNGDLHAAVKMKVTKDENGQYHFYLNQQAIKYLLMYAKDIPGPIAQKRAESPDCPPEVPDFLRWDSRGSEGSKSAPTVPGSLS
jgi:hypothetical protein